LHPSTEKRVAGPGGRLSLGSIFSPSPTWTQKHAIRILMTLLAPW
jgi:hypothetical protein